MVAKNALEYVRIDGHSAVETDLLQSSGSLKQAMDTSIKASEIQAEKHEKIAEAKRLITELLEKISELNRLMMREKFAETLRRPKSVVYRETKKKIVVRKKIRTEDDREVLARSEKALGNLQKNLEVLKKQLY
jgi:hypothetical protein